MAGRADLMRQRYEEFNRGDIESATQEWANDFVWQGANSTDLPGGGETRGKQEALNDLRQAISEWDEFRLSTDEFFENGDTVVVLAHTDVRKGDRSGRLPVVHIWRWEGDEAKRLQILTDTYWAAQLLGIA